MRRQPWLVIAILLALTALCASGIPKLRFSDDFRSYFGPANPELLAFEELQATYAKSDNILFVVKPPGGEVFVPAVLELLERLTEEAWLLPYASRVDSVTNFQHSWADGDDLTVESLVSDGARMRPAKIAQRRAIALDEPLLRGLLLSPDADTAGVNVVLQLPAESLDEVPEAVAAARTLAKKIESEHPGTRVALSGVTLLNHAFSDSGQRDAATLMPVMFVVLTLFMLLALRSFAATVATLGVVVLSATTALGLAGHLGIALSPVAVTAPTIIMTLAIADSVHILASFLDSRSAGSGKARALADSLSVNLLPVSITSLTTVVGFLTLNFADTPPFHDLGNITALGIGAAWLYSLSLLPAAMVLLPIRARARESSPARLDRLAIWITRNRRAVLACAALVALGLIGSLSLLELNDQWVDYFDRRVEFRRDADFTDEHLTGLYLVEYSLPAGAREGIHDPKYLAVLESFTGWLRHQPEVRHVASYADIVKRINRNLHLDDPEFFRVPEDRERAAQYLLLFELSLPYGLDLNDRISVDKAATRLTATLGGGVTTRETHALLARAQRWLESHAPPRMQTTASGLGVMFAHISERNIASMLRGNVLAVALIAVILMLALRSVQLGLLSLVPNTLPILMTFGVWSLASGKVGMAAAMVSVSSLGIVVDDTVHFLTKYLHARRQRRLARPQAIRYAFRTVGRAIVSTTAILTAGFMVLTLSTFRINFELGLLTAIALTLALLTDFLVLPALLLWGHPIAEEETTNHDFIPAQS